MNGIDFGCAGYVGGDDVNPFAAQTLVYLGCPYGGAAFGGQEEFGENQQFCVGGGGICQ